MKMYTISKNIAYLYVFKNQYVKSVTIRHDLPYEIYTKIEIYREIYIHIKRFMKNTIRSFYFCRPDERDDQFVARSYPTLQESREYPERFPIGIFVGDKYIEAALASPELEA